MASSSPKAHIKMLFDISSPWSRIAYTILFRYKDVWNVDIELVPIFLGGIMVATGNTPPSALGAPLWHVGHDTVRVSQRFGVDVRSPPGHPLKTSSLNQIRFLRALSQEEGQETLAKCVGLIFNEFYSVQTLYTSPEFWECLIPVLGREKLDRIMKLSQTTETKDGVKNDVKRAVEEYGMFGAPWFVATRPTDGKKDVFFGCDKLEAMAWWLGPQYVWRGPYPDGDDSVAVSQIQLREARL